jgi:hypothetical protein
LLDLLRNPEEGIEENIDLKELRKAAGQPWRVLNPWKEFPLASAASIVIGILAFGLIWSIVSLLMILWNSLLRRILELRSAIKGDIS